MRLLIGGGGERRMPVFDGLGLGGDGVVGRQQRDAVYLDAVLEQL